MNIISETFSVIPGFFDAQRKNSIRKWNRISSYHRLEGVDYGSIISCAVVVIGYVVKWIGGNSSGKSSWDKYDDAQKEKCVHDFLAESYRMGLAGEAPANARIVDLFASMIQQVAPGPDWPTFLNDNSDWLPNRIKAAEELYGHPFNSRPSEWKVNPITTQPGAGGNTNNPTGGSLTTLNTSEASFGIIGNIILVGIGVFMFYESFNNDDTKGIQEGNDQQEGEQLKLTAGEGSLGRLKKHFRQKTMNL